MDHSARNGLIETFFFNQFRSRVFGTSTMVGGKRSAVKRPTERATLTATTSGRRTPVLFLTEEMENNVFIAGYCNNNNYAVWRRPFQMSRDLSQSDRVARRRSGSFSSETVATCPGRRQKKRSHHRRPLSFPFSITFEYIRISGTAPNRVPHRD